MFSFFTSYEAVKVNNLKLTNRPQVKYILNDTLEVEHRIKELGWGAVTEILDIAHSASTARNAATLNDPIGAASFYAWGAGTRRMREIGIQKGWERDDTNQIPSVFDRENNVRFVFCNMDSGTGDVSRTPQNRSKKGSSTVKLIDENQRVFTFYKEIAELTTDEKTNSIYWYICVHSDDGVLKVELSCPDAIREGFICGYSQRIILDCGEEQLAYKDADIVPTTHSEAFTVNVTRKKP